MRTTKPARETVAPGRDHLLVRRFRLRVLAGPGAGTQYETARERLTLGTHPSTDFRLQDPTMSRFHCEITVNEGKLTVRDLGSRNGTMVDGVTVMVALLHDRSTLTLGETRLRVELSDDEVKVPISERERFGLLSGRSRPMRSVFATLEQAAQSHATVLLEGETGTGKDAAAESIHLESDRRNGPFVVIDCGALPQQLLESELFGHERGAFTGADRARAGAFETAHGGTLFLDEIGELSLDLQPKFLRVLESGQVQRIGSRQRIGVDVRVIAATNRNLRQEVNARRFRSDLYYRLAVLEVTLPPLRDRLEDLPLLVERLLDGSTRKGARADETLRSRAFLDELARHSWPGNVRELRNYLERCLALKRPPPLEGAPGTGSLTVDLDQPFGVLRDRWLLQLERRYLEALLERHKGNISEAARAAGLARGHFYRLMARCGLR